MESYDNQKRTPHSWKTIDRLGGGVLQHFLSHSLHYLELLFGKVKKIRCLLEPAKDLHPEGSAYASLDLMFDDLMVHVAASTSAYGGIGHSLEIYGSEGSLVLKNEMNDPVLGFKLYHAMRGQEMQLVEEEAKYHPLPASDSRIFPISRLIGQWIDSIGGKATTHPTIDAGHRVQELLESARKAAKNHQWTNVSHYEMEDSSTRP